MPVYAFYLKIAIYRNKNSAKSLYIPNYEQGTERNIFRTLFVTDFISNFIVNNFSSFKLLQLIFQTLLSFLHLASAKKALNTYQIFQTLLSLIKMINALKTPLLTYTYSKPKCI